MRDAYRAMRAQIVALGPSLHRHEIGGAAPVVGAVAAAAGGGDVDSPEVASSSRSMDLPVFVKHVLVAAYVASHNPVESDAKVWRRGGVYVFVVLFVAQVLCATCCVCGGSFSRGNGLAGRGVLRGRTRG